MPKHKWLEKLEKSLKSGSNKHQKTLWCRKTDKEIAETLALPIYTIKKYKMAAFHI